MVSNILVKDRFLTGSKTDQLFFLLVISDLFFIGVHCLVELGFFEKYYVLLSITTDQSIPEFFQYLKELWIALIMGTVFWIRKNLIYLFWAFLFFFFLIDDFAAVHEHIGSLVSKDMNMEAKFGLRPADFGELFAILIVGILFVLPLLIVFPKSDTEGKITSLVLTALVLGLVFFGVFVDLIHAASHHLSKYLSKFLAVVEDGGEMLVMSGILWYSFNQEYFNKAIFSKGIKSLPSLIRHKIFPESQR